MKQKLLYTAGGIGIGLMLSAAFVGIAKWAVTLGLLLVIASIVLRYFFEK